jgi:2-dehydro-3-deoxyphosphogluconate aldolase/(4S)-4-hydroxy-2-oxoglutarate aldolase
MRDSIHSAVEQSGVIAIVRLDDLSAATHVTTALAEGGIRCIEFTLTSTDAIAALGKVREATSPELFLGIGTVLDTESARAAILAGSDFIVTPTLQTATIALCRRYTVPCMIGAFTPTEILAAWEHGADYVKLFPASVGGPRYLREIRGPLPQVKLVPTGGVSTENASDFIKAGAVALGVGSNLVNAATVAAGDWVTLTRRSREFVEAVQRSR